MMRILQMKCSPPLVFVWHSLNDVSIEWTRTCSSDRKREAMGTRDGQGRDAEREREKEKRGQYVYSIIKNLLHMSRLISFFRPGTFRVIITIDPSSDWDWWWRKENEREHAGQSSERRRERGGRVRLDRGRHSGVFEVYECSLCDAPEGISSGESVRNSTLNGDSIRLNISRADLLLNCVYKCEASSHTRLQKREKLSRG